VLQFSRGGFCRCHIHSWTSRVSGGILCVANAVKSLWHTARHSQGPMRRRLGHSVSADVADIARTQGRSLQRPCEHDIRDMHTSCDRMRARQPVQRPCNQLFSS